MKQYYVRRKTVMCWTDRDTNVYRLEVVRRNTRRTIRPEELVVSKRTNIYDEQCLWDRLSTIRPDTNLTEFAKVLMAKGCTLTSIDRRRVRL